MRCSLMYSFAELYLTDHAQFGLVIRGETQLFWYVTFMSVSGLCHKALEENVQRCENKVKDRGGPFMSWGHPGGLMLVSTFTLTFQDTRLRGQHTRPVSFL